jgi:hypothetical protein
MFNGLWSEAREAAVASILEEPCDLGPNLGLLLLYIAAGKAAKQGYYATESGIKVEPAFLLLSPTGEVYPLFREDQMRFHLIYHPIVLPQTELTCLAEPGAKTRPLGKNQTWFTLVCRAMRFMAEPILARDGRARIGLRSTNKMWTFLKFLSRNLEGSSRFPDPVCQSTDYKSATDLIPLQVIEAMWTGFLRGLPKRHPFWVFFNLVLCRREISVDPRYSEAVTDLIGESFRHERGSFMGEPLSFLTLTLENMVIEEMTMYYSTIPVELWTTPVIQLQHRDPCCICGDDVAALRQSLAVILLFRRIFQALGWKASWKDLVSRRILIFCEDHVLLEGHLRDIKVSYIDVIKSRLLTTMSREHSENRSSILGKGRMLSNQLGYFNDRLFKTAVISYYSLIFNRAYQYSVLGKLTLPFYLPPSGGGIGFPVLDTLLPGWMWPYIGYIYEILSISDFRERFLKLEALSSLNTRLKKGISSPDKVRILVKETARFRYKEEGLLGPLQPHADVVYDDAFIISYLNTHGTEVPLDPYGNKFDFSSLENEASVHGFVPFTSFSDEVERVLNFRAFFSGRKVREQRTFNQWVRDSARFWRKNLPKGRLISLGNLGRERFTKMVDLEKAIQRANSGWIYIGEDPMCQTLINSGPSLKFRLWIKLAKFNYGVRCGPQCRSGLGHHDRCKRSGERFNVAQPGSTVRPATTQVWPPGWSKAYLKGLQTGGLPAYTGAVVAPVLPVFSRQR